MYGGDVTFKEHEDPASIIQYDSTDSRDCKGVDVAHEKNITQKPASLFPDDDEAVLVR